MGDSTTIAPSPGSDNGNRRRPAGRRRRRASPRPPLQHVTNMLDRTLVGGDVAGAGADLCAPRYALLVC